MSNPKEQEMMGSPPPYAEVVQPSQSGHTAQPQQGYSSEQYPQGYPAGQPYQQAAYPEQMPLNPYPGQQYPQQMYPGGDPQMGGYPAPGQYPGQYQQQPYPTQYPGQPPQMGAGAAQAMLVAPQQVEMVRVADGTTAPDSHMLFSVLATLCCCWPIGIFAIIKSMDVSNALASGDRQRAEQSSVRAYQLAKYAVIGGCVCLSLSVVFLVVVTLAAYCILVYINNQLYSLPYTTNHVLHLHPTKLLPQSPSFQS